MAAFGKKKPKSPPLSPGRKLFLTAWSCVVLCFAFVLSAKMAPNFRIAFLILAVVIGGVLFGLKLLRKMDGLLVALGLVNPTSQTDAAGNRKPGLEDLVGFLRKVRKKGQFSRPDFEKFCYEEGFTAEPLLKVMLDKGWILEQKTAFLITSKGEELLDKAM
jgi:hypothetical protein